MNVYLFSPIPYTFLHQRPQKLADQFVASGIPVTYIEPCGFTEYLAGRKKGIVRLLTTSAWFWLLGLLALFVRQLQLKVPPKSKGDTTTFRIVSMPLVVPQNRFNSALLEKLNAAIFRQVLLREVFPQMSPGERSIAIVENPFWGSVLQREDFSNVYYDCLDEITLFSGHADPERFMAFERNLVQQSSGVFVTAEKLEHQLRLLRSDVPIVRVPNGVDFSWFQSRAREGGVPGDIATLKKPIAGYVGVLRSWIDYELVAALAQELPDISVVMVGPLDFEKRIEHLRKIPNLHWLGRRDYAEVPLYINSFDACIIPFIRGKISETTNPVKVFEYFALGKPVVSTPLHELEPFAADGLALVAESRSEFLAAVRRALADKDEERSCMRMDVARKHSWNEHVRTMLTMIESTA
jgi:glycosyltransferase involved in cell wall biosynthesis